MDAQQQATWALIRTCVGREIEQIQRVFFDWNGEVDETDGQVIFVFRDSSVLRFIDAAGGDRIEVSETTWMPPNIQPGSPGSWKLVDVSATSPFAGLIGVKILAVKPLLSRFGALTGVNVVVGGSGMFIVAQGDECHVLWRTDELEPRQLRIVDEDDKDHSRPE